MRRAAALSVVLGLVLSFSTGLSPAGAQTASVTRMEEFELAPYWVAGPYTGESTAGFPLFGPLPAEWSIGVAEWQFSGSGNTMTRRCATYCETSFTVIPDTTSVTVDWYGADTDTTSSGSTACELLVNQPRVNTVWTSVGYFNMNDTSWPPNPVNGPDLAINGLQAGEPVTMSLRNKGNNTGGANLLCGIERVGQVRDVVAPLFFPPVPQLACGRTMYDLGGGQWAAEVTAMVRNPPVSTTNEDFPGSWRTSWDAGQFHGITQTIPLPAGAAPGDGHEATYTMRRDYETGTVWRFPEVQKEKVVEEEILTGEEVVGGPVVGPNLLVGIQMIAEWIMSRDERQGGGSLQAVDESGAALSSNDATGTKIVKSVYARCSINIDVPTTPEAAGPQWIILDLPDNPTDPSPPTDGGTPTPPPPDDGGCRGGSWWNPVTWAKSVFCRIGDIVDWLGGLVDLLVDWLIPSDVGPRADAVEGDFTGSLAGKGIAAATTFGSDLEAAVNSPAGCGALFPSLTELDSCITSDGGSGVRDTVAGATHQLMRVLLYVLTGLRIWRTMPWAGRESAVSPL